MLLIDITDSKSFCKITNFSQYTCLEILLTFFILTANLYVSSSRVFGHNTLNKVFF